MVETHLSLIQDFDPNHNLDIPDFIHNPNQDLNFDLYNNKDYGSNNECSKSDILDYETNKSDYDISNLIEG